MSLIEHAPAKINLGLHVLRQRPDGYHDIETVFHRIDWTDTITAEPAQELSLTCSDPELPTDERNLCLQAARRLADAFDVSAGAQLHLDKRVPYGAGLGGGSSDAAATLRLLVRLWELTPKPRELQEIAQSIGADVSFFLRDEPAAYATGRGDQLAPLYQGSDPYRLPFPVLIAAPPATVDTPWAYTQVTPKASGRPDLRQLVPTNDVAQWQESLTNDFEGPVSKAYPSVEALLRRLSTDPAAYVSLSGSGGSVYAIFPSEEGVQQARDLVEGPRIRTHVMWPSK